MTGALADGPAELATRTFSTGRLTGRSATVLVMPSAYVRVPSIVPTATSAPPRPSKRVMSNVPLNVPGPFPSLNVPLTGIADTGEVPAPGLCPATVLAPRTKTLITAAVMTGPSRRRFTSYLPAHWPRRPIGNEWRRGNGNGSFALPQEVRRVEAREVTKL